VLIRLYKNHFLTWAPFAIKDNGWDKRLSAEGWDFLSCLADEDATHVCVATEGGVLIGWFRFTYQGEHLFAQGTWVEDHYRRQGVATRLWDRALARVRPFNINYDLASREGGRLVRTMKKRMKGRDLMWWEG
jgi:GNAT superfamily N-acetyltransferase